MGLAKAGLNGGVVIFSSSLNSRFYSNSIKGKIYTLKEDNSFKAV